MPLQIDASKRFSPRNPCPICGGHAALPHGHKVRCFGYLDDSGEYARCTREEHAGLLPQNLDGTFSHRLHGACRCGQEHSPVAALGSLSLSRARPLGPPQRWASATEDGELIGWHCRQDYDDGSKRTWWTDAQGNNGLGGRHVDDLPLYGVARLRQRPSEPVIVTEGEKAAEALIGLGLLALGTVTGAGSANPKTGLVVPRAPSHASLKVLLGRGVYLWPDNDEIGRAHMALIARRLASLGQPCYEVFWPGAGEKDDAADFVARGGTAAGVMELVEGAEQVPSPLGQRVELEWSLLRRLATAVEHYLAEPDAPHFGRLEQAQRLYQQAMQFAREG